MGLYNLSCLRRRSHSPKLYQSRWDVLCVHTACLQLINGRVCTVFVWHEYISLHKFCCFSEGQCMHNIHRL